MRLEKNYECPQLRLLPVIDLFRKTWQQCPEDPSGANLIELDSKPSWEYTSVYNSAYQQEESASRKNFYYYKLVSGLILYQWILLTVIHECITSSVKLKLSVAKIRSIWIVVESNGSASLLLNTHQSITNSREAQWQELYSKLFSQYRYRTKLIMVDGAPKICK